MRFASIFSSAVFGTLAYAADTAADMKVQVIEDAGSPVLLRREVPTNEAREHQGRHGHNKQIEGEARWAERIERHAAVSTTETHGASHLDEKTTRIGRHYTDKEKEQQIGEKHALLTPFANNAELKAAIQALPDAWPDKSPDSKGKPWTERMKQLIKPAEPQSLVNSSDVETGLKPKLTQITIGIENVNQAIEVWAKRGNALTLMMEALKNEIQKQATDESQRDGTTEVGITIYPTGSGKLTSDKDIQIGLEIGNKNPKKDPWSLESKGFLCIQKIGEAVKHLNAQTTEWLIEKDEKSVEHNYDINWYPPTLIQKIPTVENFDASQNGLSSKTFWKNGENIFFAPNFKNKQNMWSFLIKDLRRVFYAFEGESNTDTRKYLDFYRSVSAADVKDLIDRAHAVTDSNWADSTFGKRWNNDIIEATAANAMGPEMYASVCSLFWVVWHMQMNSPEPNKNDVVGREYLEHMAAVATIEQYFHYNSNGKDKYKERCCHAYGEAKEEVLRKLWEYMHNLAVENTDKLHSAKWETFDDGQNAGADSIKVRMKPMPFSKPVGKLIANIHLNTNFVNLVKAEAWTGETGFKQALQNLCPLPQTLSQEN